MFDLILIMKYVIVNATDCTSLNVLCNCKFLGSEETAKKQKRRASRRIESFLPVIILLTALETT